MAEYSKHKPLFVIAGPTASGKTSLAVSLAKHLDGEVISADSMQIYKEMNISTAKPSLSEREGIPHHLMDFLSVREEFSVAQYVKLARGVITQLHENGKIPIVAGGTGLYIDSLIQNIQFSAIGSDDELRRKYQKQAEEYGNDFLLKKLSQVDPLAAGKLHPNNIGRIIRALEVYALTGVPMSEHVKRSKMRPSEYLVDGVVLMFEDRSLLYDRINRRVDRMMEEGLLQEARDILRANPCKTARQAIGYKEFIPFFRGEISLEGAVDKLKQETRRYAKRQITWFKRSALKPVFIDGLNESEVLKTVVNIVENSVSCGTID